MDPNDWIKTVLHFDVVAQRKAAPGQPAAGAATAAAAPSTEELMDRAVAKAKQEVVDAEADYRQKMADVDAKDLEFLDTVQPAGQAFLAKDAIEKAEAAETAADANGASKDSSPSDPSAAELLRQAKAKAEAEFEAAAARSEAARQAAIKASDDAEKAKKRRDDKIAAEKQVEAAATAEKTASEALKPIPRPMEPDCKIARNRIPDVPDKNIVLCATHGHVIDEDKKLIVAADPDSYRLHHLSSKKAVPA